MLERLVAFLLVVLVLGYWQSKSIPTVPNALGSSVPAMRELNQDLAHNAQPAAIVPHRITWTDVTAPSHAIDWRQLINPQDRAAWLVFVVLTIVGWLVLTSLAPRELTISLWFP